MGLVLRPRDHARRTFHRLHGCPRARSVLGETKRLNRVHHDKIGLHIVHGGEHVVKEIRREHVKIGLCPQDPLCARFDLRFALLPRRVEDFLPHRVKSPGQFQEERRFADPGRCGENRNAVHDEAAAHHAIEFRDPREDARFPRRLDGPETHRGARGGGFFLRPLFVFVFRHVDLFRRAPLSAFGALPEPVGSGMSTCRTSKCSLHGTPLSEFPFLSISQNDSRGSIESAHRAKFSFVAILTCVAQKKCSVFRKNLNRHKKSAPHWERSFLWFQN